MTRYRCHGLLSYTCSIFPIITQTEMQYRGAVILLAENRKSLTKVTENWERLKSSVESRKEHLCWKPENAIFKSQKPRKMGKYGGNRKTQFKFAETVTVFLEAAESRKSLKR